MTDVILHFSGEGSDRAPAWGRSPVGAIPAGSSEAMAGVANRFRSWRRSHLSDARIGRPDRPNSKKAGPGGARGAVRPNVYGSI